MTEIDRDLLLLNSMQIEAYIIGTFHFQASLLTVNIYCLAGSISALLSFFIHITHILSHPPTIACGSRTLFSSSLCPHHSYPSTVPSFANGHTHDIDSLHPALDDMDNLHLAPDDMGSLHLAPNDMGSLHLAPDDMGSSILHTCSTWIPSNLQTTAWRLTSSLIQTSLHAPPTPSPEMPMTCPKLQNIME